MIMRSKKMIFSNFCHSVTTLSNCYRPDKENQLENLDLVDKKQGLLARGNGLSYSDCCVNHEGSIIDTSRLNHLLSFDPLTEIACCQAGATFADLFLLHPDYIPPVIPGTLFATIAGGIANDIHGKNNPREATLGQHIQWLDLQVQAQTLRCSRQENSELFFASIGGLGLTGIIKRVGIQLRKNNRFVCVQTEKYNQWEPLLQNMQQHALQHDYQVAWLDFLNQPRALLSAANHCDTAKQFNHSLKIPLPPLPFRLIYPWNMKLFNQYYFRHASLSPSVQPLHHFNNPLDSIKRWPNLYGKKGFLQFQAVFDEKNALTTLHELNKIMTLVSATPTLAVLKYFTQSGSGLLSFAQPGFTLAIDFINNQEAKTAILAMNAYISAINGKIYLAKDRLLTRDQFRQQYRNYQPFSDIIAQASPLYASDLGRRLGLVT